MRAIILAGGKGRRLAPYTVSFPKPLVPIGDVPVLEIVIRQLKAAGFERITLAVGHLAELLMAYFGDGEKWGVHIDYSREDVPLGTVGPLALIDDLPETFLVMNGDVLTTLRYDDLFDYHQENGAELTIACHRCNSQVDLGVIDFNGSLHVTNYREKPTLHYDVSMGVYIFNRTVLDLFEPGERVDFPDLVNTLIARENAIKVCLSDEIWLDIGRPDDYAQATETFAKMRRRFLYEGRRIASAAHNNGHS